MRTRTPKPFHVALEAANKRLAAAIKERAVCNEKLALLNVEIPSLQQTIQALGNQVRPVPTSAVHASQVVFRTSESGQVSTSSPLTEAERLRQTILGDDDESDS